MSIFSNSLSLFPLGTRRLPHLLRAQREEASYCPRPIQVIIIITPIILIIRRNAPPTNPFYCLAPYYHYYYWYCCYYRLCNGLILITTLTILIILIIWLIEKFNFDQTAQVLAAGLLIGARVRAKNRRSQPHNFTGRCLTFHYTKRAPATRTHTHLRAQVFNWFVMPVAWFCAMCICWVADTTLALNV